MESIADDIQPPGILVPPDWGYSWDYSWDGSSSTPNWYHLGGMNVAFVDGHVAWYPEDDEDLNNGDQRLWKGTE